MRKILLPLLFVTIYISSFAQGGKYEAFMKTGQEKLDDKDYSGAYFDFNGALSVKLTEINKYLKIRKEYDNLSEFEKASLESAEIYAPRNDYAQPYYYRGLASAGLGKKEEAMQDFETAIYCDAKYAGPYYERGKLKYDKGDKDGGCIDIRTAGDYGSAAAKEYFEDKFCWNSSINYSREGTTKLNLKQYDAAISDFNIAIKLNPDSAGNYARRGSCYYGSGKFSNAISDFNRAIDISPNISEYYYQRGLAYYSWERYKEAFADFSKALSFDGNYIDALMYRAASCEGMGNWKSAIYDYGQVIRVKPEDGLGYFKRALAKQEVKDKTACTDFKKAAALGHEEAQDYANGCK